MYISPFSEMHAVPCATIVEAPEADKTSSEQFFIRYEGSPCMKNVVQTT